MLETGGKLDLDVAQITKNIIFLHDVARVNYLTPPYPYLGVFNQALVDFLSKFLTIGSRGFEVAMSEPSINKKFH